MELLKKNLPVSIRPLVNNPQGKRHQAHLTESIGEELALRVREALALEADNPVSVEFCLAKHNFIFDTMVRRIIEGKSIHVLKPKRIRKKKGRSGPRIRLELPIDYSLWPFRETLHSRIADISVSGMRMHGAKQLKQETIINLSMDLPGGSLKIKTQAQVIWSKKSEQNEYLYETGLKFTTLSDYNHKRLEDYLTIKAREKLATLNR